MCAGEPPCVQYNELTMIKKDCTYTALQVRQSLLRRILCFTQILEFQPEDTHF